MGKWVQKGGYRKKKCTKRKYTFHSVENMCMVIRKKKAKPRLGGSLQVSVILGLYNFLHKAHFGSALLYPKSFCGV